MHLNPYLLFNGNCETALHFYEKCFGAKVIFLMRYSEMPAGENSCSDPALAKKIMHARLEIGDKVIMAADAPPDRFEKPQGFFVSINLEDPVEAERVFEALAEKAEIRMPIQETFWAHRFGMLVDQYGTPWMINCEKSR